MNRPGFDAAVFFEKDVKHAQEIPRRSPRLCRPHGHGSALRVLLRVCSVQGLAPKPDVGSETLRRWVVQPQVDAGEKDSATTDERDELQRLRAENRGKYA